MNPKRSVRGHFETFSLGPRSPGDFLHSPQTQGPYGYLSFPPSSPLSGLLVLDPYNEYYACDSDDLDVSSTGTVLRSLNLTLRQALEDKDFLEAASSVSSYFREAPHEVRGSLGAYTQYPSWLSGQPQQPGSDIAIASSLAALLSDDDAPSVAGYKEAIAGDSFIRSFLSSILSVDDYSEIIAAYQSFITGISITVAKVHRHVLHLITGSPLLINRISKSIEGFIAFTTWPRPPTSR